MNLRRGFSPDATSTVTLALAAGAAPRAGADFAADRGWDSGPDAVAAPAWEALVRGRPRHGSRAADAATHTQVRSPYNMTSRCSRQRCSGHGRVDITKRAVRAYAVSGGSVRYRRR
jgi:hypothetical protein